MKQEFVGRVTDLKDDDRLIVFLGDVEVGLFNSKGCVTMEMAAPIGGRTQ